MRLQVSTVMGDNSQEEGWVVCRIFKKKNHHKTLDSPISSSMAAETRNQQMFDPCGEGALEQILEYMGRSCKEESEAANTTNTSARRFLQPINTAGFGSNGYHDRFLKLPSLESPNSTSSTYQSMNAEMVTDSEATINGSRSRSSEPNNNHMGYQMDSSLSNWVALDRLVASQLNGQTEASRQLSCFSDPTIAYCNDDDHPLQMPNVRSSSNRSYHAPHPYSSEIDLWTFARSSSSLSSSDPLCHVSTSPI